MKDEYSRLRGVFRERVDEYTFEVTRHGLAEARPVLLTEMRRLVVEDPDTAARLLAGAIDLFAEDVPNPA